MNKPILSICIPTRNRGEILRLTLLNITSNEYFLETNDIEIVISDNCSDDNTQDICLDFQNKYPEKIRYIRNEKNIGDENFINVLKLAKGKYAKLNNDSFAYKFNALNYIVDVLKEIDNDIIFFSNEGHWRNGLEINNYKNFDEFLNVIGYKCTWIGGLCVKTEAFIQLENPERFSKINFAQVDILARMSKNKHIAIINGNMMTPFYVPNKGGYNIAKVFGENLIILLKELIKERLVSSSTFEKVIKKTLVEHINHFYFDFENSYCYKKGGYFKYLFKYYKTKPYYYMVFFKAILKIFMEFLYKSRKSFGFKEITVLGIKIRIKLSQQYSRWREKNGHNKTTLAHEHYRNNVIVGNGTYGEINHLIANQTNNKLVIGNYCSISNGVKFILAVEHDYDTFSTYPFKFFNLNLGSEAKSKGDIIIKDDVWIGENALILSGVKIGQGAIIGAGAVVTKDVPPYSIVGGNPAKVIKYRFEAEIIKKLLQFKYSKLTEDKIKLLNTKLYDKITMDNVDELLREFSSNV